MRDETPIEETELERPAREPFFNPQAFEAAPVIALTLAMIGIHVWVDYMAVRQQNLFYGEYGFVSAVLWQGKSLWTLISHAMLHGNWMHLGFNVVAFFVLGSACWKLMGTGRFFAFFAVTAAAGAALFAVVRPDEYVVLVGVSGVIFGLIAAVKRVEFRIRSLRGQDMRMAMVKFIGLIVAINVFIGFVPIDDGTGFAGASVAWEAHIGGFLAGWLVTPWLVKFWPS